MKPQNYNKLNFKERKKVREQYKVAQNNLCYFCKKDLDFLPPSDILKKRINKNLFPETFFNNPVHLHHNHETGMTIGAVHCYCNAILWQYYGE